MVRNTDRDFLLSIGVQPYEPDLFDPQPPPDLRDRFIQAIAILQMIVIAAALVYTSL